MRYIFGFILALVLIIIFINSYRKNRDIFSPMCIFTFYQFIEYVPSILFATIDYGQVIDDSTVLPTFIFEFFFILSVLMGYYLKFKRGTNRQINIDKKNLFNAVIYKRRSILLIYCLGLAGKIYTITRSGGISYIINNTAVSYLKLTSGSGFTEILKYLTFISIMLMIYRASKTKNKSDIIYSLIMIIIYMILDMIYSRRSTAITLILLALFCINYFTNRIKIRKFLKPQYILLILSLCGIIVVLPYIRKNTFVNYNIAKTQIVSRQSMNDIMGRLSMVGRDVFVYNYFNLGNFWLGRSYLNLFVSFIPSSIWTYKPAVDEGRYLKHLMNGIDISPNASVTSMLFKESIPFTMPGILYANFGIIGIIIGGFTLGYIYKLSYKQIMQRDKTVFNYVLYRMVIFDFGLTVMYLTNFIAEFMIYLIVLLLFKRGVKIQTVNVIKEGSNRKN